VCGFSYAGSGNEAEAYVGLQLEAGSYGFLPWTYSRAVFLHSQVRLKKLSISNGSCLSFLVMFL
jgi:hypothetical protein